MFYLILKYIISSIVEFGVILILINKYLNYNIDIFEFILMTIFIAAIEIIIYFVIIFLIDNKTKILFNMLINELKN